MSENLYPKARKYPSDLPFKHTLCEPEQVTIFFLLLMKWIYCYCITTVSELRISEYNHKVFLLKVKCEH